MIGALPIDPILRVAGEHSLLDLVGMKLALEELLGALPRVSVGASAESDTHQTAV